MEKSSQSPSFGQGLELIIIVIKAIASVVKEFNVAGEKIQELIEKPGQVFKSLENLLVKNHQSQELIEKPGQVFKSLENLLVKNHQSKESNTILSLLSFSGTLVLEALDGKSTIARAENVFKSYISPNFKNWHLDNKGEATKETAVQIYGMIQDDAKFLQMFNSLSSDLDSLCLTQNQIIRFCEKHPSYLRQNGYATFFLFKENNEYFVASVEVLSDGLSVDVVRFERGGVWFADDRHCVVSPQLSN